MFNKGKCIWKRMNWGLTCWGAALKKMTQGSLGQMTQSSFRCPFWAFQVKNKTSIEGVTYRAQVSECIFSPSDTRWKHTAVRGTCTTSQQAAPFVLSEMVLRELTQRYLTPSPGQSVSGQVTTRRAACDALTELSQESKCPVSVETASCWYKFLHSQNASFFIYLFCFYWCVAV